MPQALIDRFVRQKSWWIEKHLWKLSTAHAALRVSDNELMIHGIVYQILHSPLLWQEYHIDEDHATIYSKKLLDTDEAKRQRYKTYAKKTLSDRLVYYADAYAIPFRKLYIRSGSSKWWSCSSDHNIGLNWKLIQFPEFVMDYVICHELAHIRQMNHSPSFRKHLASIYPDRKTAKKWLKTYGVGLQ